MPIMVSLCSEFFRCTDKLAHLGFRIRNLPGRQWQGLGSRSVIGDACVLKTGDFQCRLVSIQDPGWVCSSPNRFCGQLADGPGTIPAWSAWSCDHGSGVMLQRSDSHGIATLGDRDRDFSTSPSPTAVSDCQRELALFLLHRGQDLQSCDLWYRYTELAGNKDWAHCCSHWQLKAPKNDQFRHQPRLCVPKDQELDNPLRRRPRASSGEGCPPLYCPLYGHQRAAGLPLRPGGYPFDADWPCAGSGSAPLCPAVQPSLSNKFLLLILYQIWDAFGLQWSPCGMGGS